jgi:G:T/U-mismatch repair DNA glycosylase
VEAELSMSSDETRLDIAEKKQDTHRRYLLGDPDDPTSPGVLTRMRDMDAKLDRIIEHVEREDNDE